MTYRTTSGRVLETGPLLGRGGEAVVAMIVNDPLRVAKIYHGRGMAARLPKVRAMIATGAPSGASQNGQATIAWPLEIVLSRANEPCGFTMPRVQHVLTVGEVANPFVRLSVAPAFSWRYLLRTARNVASVMASVHAGGAVIGDVNDRNLVVGSSAIASLVDVDSIQLRIGGYTYRCPVGTGPFTPPELQGLDFSVVDREPRHDGFGLAVLVFQLLLLGYHPFSLRWRGHGDAPSLEENIAARRYAGRPGPRWGRPPFAPPLALLPRSVRLAFEAAFCGGPLERPSASDWTSILGSVEPELRTCQRNTQHVYPSMCASCPWCERRRLLGGRDPFPWFTGAVAATSRSSLVPVPGRQTPASVTSFIGSHRALAGATRRHRDPVASTIDARLTGGLIRLVRRANAQLGWPVSDSAASAFAQRVAGRILAALRRVRP